MNELDIFATTTYNPLSFLGMDHPFFRINVQTIINTWIVIGIILFITLPISHLLRKRHHVISHLLISYVKSFYDMVHQTLDTYFSFNHFAFITALFTFVSLCNVLGAIPWLDEPTKDLNTTLSLGIVSFLYTQFYAIKIHGIGGYIKEYFAPFFIMLPLNIIGKIATIISISFRLFGNIFGGFMIAHIFTSAIKGKILWETLGLLSGLNLIIVLFFGLFEAFLQAFVFTMLALTYLSIGIQGEAPEETD
jgi:F-type H+-transporting ATPase subunit a